MSDYLGATEGRRMIPRTGISRVDLTFTSAYTRGQAAAYNSDMASRLQAAVTRLRRFEDEGAPH